MTARQLLALRGGAASVVATFVAALSHSWAGGALPAPLLIVGMAVLLVFPGMALMGRRPRVRRIAVTVPVLQGIFHGAFSVLGAPVSGTRAIGGHHHDHAGAWELLAGTGAAAQIDAAMLAAHAAAAVVTFAMLAYGERAVLMVRAWVSGWARSRVVVPGWPTRPRVSVVASSRVLRSRLGDRIACPRGPPVPAV
ncbi:hypothetical protein [Microbacterium sp.]|uniref:hypothetical protein n=1 Tax=Microbacterium sp. TaxID=51671 RepID=UPI003F9815D2